MSYKPADFQSEIALNTAIWKWYANVEVRAHAHVDAVKADLTTHDRTIEAPLGILLKPNAAYQTDINAIINKGKGGNLTVAQMGTAMDAVVATLP